jgi:uncharacterized repeat protein (TIGR01451 family)
MTRPAPLAQLRVAHFAQFVAAVAMVAAAAVPARAEPELTATGAAIATGSDLLETAIVVEKLVSPARAGSGAARYVPAERLAAGDEAFYTIRVHNPGKEAVTDVRVTKRMPQGMEYIAGSAVGPACEVEYSSDGGATFHAKPADVPFTHVRWILREPLPSGATALLRFRATFR